MGYDPFSPICETRLNVLCVPATTSSRDSFKQCVSAIQSCSLVSLKSVQRELVTNEGIGFVTSAWGEGTNLYIAVNKLNFVDGTVVLDIGVNLDVLDNLDLFPVIVNRQPQVILGIVTADDILSTSTGEHDAQVQSIRTEFQRFIKTFQNLIYGVLVIFGGPPPADSDDTVWVDTEGSGPSVPNVLARVVKVCCQRIPLQLQLMRRRLPELKQSINPSPRPSIGTPAIMSTPTSATFRMGYGRVEAPPTPSLPLSPEAQENIITARMSVLHGMLNLQTGQWPEALRQLSEGASGARSFGDSLWYARALEGTLTCLLMHVWAQIDFIIPQICYPHNERHANYVNSGQLGSIIAANRVSSMSLFSSSSSNSLNGLSDLMPQLIGLIFEQYDRATNSVEETDLAISACEARVRWTNLLISIKDSGGVLQASTLRSLLEGTHGRSQPKSKSPVPSRLNLSKSSLCRLLIDAATEAQVKLSVQQSAIIHINIVRSLSRLGLERKQGFYMKEFLQKLGPALADARKLGAAEVGMHPSASLPPLEVDEDGLGSQASNGVGMLLDIVTRVYGLSVRSHEDGAQNSSPEQRLSKALKFWSATQSSSDLFMKLEVLSDCIELSDAIPDPQGSVYFISHLLQAAKKTMTLSLERPDTSPFLAAGDQSRLLNNMKRTITMAEKLGMPGLRAEFWDKFLVRNVQLIEDPHTNRLIPHTARDVSIAVGGDKPEEKKDPFIFNPFAKAKSVSSLSVITVGEMASFSVVLQNALDIDVEIEDIILLTDGCTFEPFHHSIVLGPLCCQAFTLSGIPRSEGELKITGCRATIRDCYEEDFLIISDDWELAIDAKRRMLSNPYSATPEVVMPNAKHVSVKVINPFPVLSVVSSSILQPSLMLLEGESTLVEVSLHNNSVFNIDFVLISFEDTVKKRLEEALGSKDLGAADLYEIQNQIASRPAVQLINEDAELTIASHEEAKFTFAVFGQPGLTYINIMIDYAHLGKPRSQITGTIYTRQLTHTFSATVNGSVDIPRCLILPLQDDLKWNYAGQSGKPEKTRLFARAIQDCDVDDQCILLIDLRNIWPQPLEIELKANQLAFTDTENESWDNAYTVSEVLQPGQMSRILLLVPRVFISDPHVAVPSLDTKRQFVVSTSKATLDSEIASRESFWYRDRLLRCLRGHWKEHNGGREGEIDMRKGIRLSSRMIDALRVDHIDIFFDLKLTQSDKLESHHDTVERKGPLYFIIKKNSFATLKATIRNRSDEDLGLILRLQPSLRNQPHNIALDLSKRFTWSGVLQQALHPVLKAGESREVELDIVTLAAGEYEVSATVEDIRGRRPYPSLPVELGSSIERRIWHARRPCWIDCVDDGNP